MGRSVVWKSKPTLEHVDRMFKVYGLTLETKQFSSDILKGKEKEAAEEYSKLEYLYQRSAFAKRANQFHDRNTVISILRELTRPNGYTIECKTTHHKDDRRTYRIFRLPEPKKEYDLGEEVPFEIIFD